MKSMHDLHPGLLLLLGALLLAAAAIVSTPGPTQAARPADGTEPLPPGASVQTVISGLVNPVAMAFDPAGRLFFTEKSTGNVRLYAGGVLQTNPVIHFTVESDGERGLLGIAIDPDFNANHYIYVYYTFCATGTCPPFENRVVRFVESNGVGSNPTVIFSSRQDAPNHNGGNIHFGHDGKLYISVGDNANAANSQNVTVKNGKIHRINPDGSIPPDNPVFTQTGALPSLFAMGLRNSFDFDFDPLTGILFASENGPGCDDEMNRIEGAFNYGWRDPYPCDDTNPSPTYNTIPPLWYLPQALCCEAPTGAAFYTGSQVPQWQNELFMASYNTGRLRHMYLDPTRHTLTQVNIVQGVTANMDIETGPDGALWYMEGGGYSPGTLKRIVGPGITPSPTSTSTASHTLTPTDTPSITPTTSVTATSTPACTGSFSLVSSPNASTGDSSLWGVASLGPNDAWAVGTSGLRGVQQNTLTMHWDGSVWSIVPSPNVPGAQINLLQAVAGTSSDDIWAAGYSINAQENASRALMAHWDGSAWSIVTVPHMDQWDEQLRALAVVSSDDVWAVGGYYDFFGQEFTWAMHWNGSAWATVNTPNVAGVGNGLYGVSALSATDIWAVGSYGDITRHTLTLHWNGAAWSTVDSPNGPDSSTLWSVKAIAPDDAWAVGYVSYTGAGPLTLHWDGSVWSVVPVPPLGQGVGGALFGVDAMASDDVLAVGYYYPDGQTSRGLALRWDGSSWSVVPVQTAGTGHNYVTRIDAGGGRIWATGYYINGATQQTLIEEYRGLPFTDVAPTDWFYEYVRCLYCRGAISGYADNTFRPYNNTTRGQMTKIVALGFAIPEATPTGGPTFNDVPPTDPFYTYVETAAAHNIVSGYNCGGPGEPCPGLYFRPFADVTRGQLSKITVAAAVETYGWYPLNPVFPTFSDVPRGSAFYTYIETAVCHEILAGYADGTFRPFNNATRAQISKIVCLAVRNESGCPPPPPTPVP